MDTDRNLHFGVLALRSKILDNDRFAEACSTWARRKGASLADVLIERGWLTVEGRRQVESLLAGNSATQRAIDGDAALVTVEAVASPSSAGFVSDSRPTLDEPTTPTGYVSPTGEYDAPDSMDRYSLTNLHAKGGIGQVWLAHDPYFGRDVALKELQPERAGRPEFWSRFVKEARVTGQLEHPGIVPIYEMGKRADDAAPFYTMRFVRGRTLSEAIAAYHDRRRTAQATRSDFRELASALVNVCNAVAYAHSRGVLHRDLKPQNVVLGDFGEVIVLDWGLARLLNQKGAEEVSESGVVKSVADAEATTLGQVLGTPAYMAPEQAEGRLDSLAPATDVYGLGAILYEILTGGPPFKGSHQDVLHRVVNNSPLSPRSVVAVAPQPLEAICLKALAKAPTDRYSSAKELGDDVQRWLADEPVTAYREPWTQRAGRWVKRHRVFVTSSAAGVVMAFVGLGAVLVQQSRANAALSAKNSELSDKNDELAAANKRVEERFELAQDAIKTFHTGVSEDFMLKEKSLTPLRKKLLGSARTFYKRLEGQLQGQNDLASRAALAKAYRTLAKLTRDIDSAEAALATYQQALALQRALAAEEGAGPDVTAEIIELLHEVAKLYRNLQKTAEAEAAARESLPLARDLIERHPDAERYQADLADSLIAVGLFLPPAEKLAYLQQSAEIYQRLVQAHPTNLEFLQGLAESTGGSGSELRSQARVADGEAAIKRAIALHEQLTQADPANPHFQNNVARWNVNLGGGLNNSRSEEALAYFRKAQGIWEKTLAEYPNSLFLLNNVAFIYDMIARRLCLMDRPQEEMEAYERESASYERAARSDPSNPVYPHEVADCQEILTLLYARAGRPADALAAAQRAVTIREELARTHPDFQSDRLAPCFLTLGDLQKAAGRAADANASFEKALAIFRKLVAAKGSKPTAPPMRGVGVALQRLGRTAEAATHYRNALALIRDPKSPNDWFELARTRALLAGIAPEPGSGVTPAEGETHAAEAVKALRRYVAGRHSTVQEAVDAGYVDVSFVDKLYQLDSLRSRAEFKQLLEEMRGQMPTKQE